MPSVCVSQISMSSPTLPRETQVFIPNCLLDLSFIQMSHRPLTLINIKATLLILTLASSSYNSLYQSMATPSFQVPRPKMLVILSSFPSTTPSLFFSLHPQISYAIISVFTISKTQIILISSPLWFNTPASF